MLFDRLVTAIENEERGVLFTVVEGESLGAKFLVFESGETVGEAIPGAAEAADEVIRGGRNRLLDLGERKVFADLYGPPPRLFVYGAVDSADALCAAAGMLGWRSIVGDARGKFATPERLPNADEIISKWPEEAIAQVAPDHQTAIVILTHDDKFDVPAIKGALETEAFYIGALGSRRNQERRKARLLEAGVAEDNLERISGPCGLDIGADSPAETAISIMGEILAVRADRAGGRLRDAAGRIHVEVPS